MGIRFPNHQVALDLIRVSGVPIAAPSANLFNHVSPSTARHVFDDFEDQDVTILDDGKTTLGIESTVMKLEDNTLSFFRFGSLPPSTVKEFIHSKFGDSITVNSALVVKKEKQKCQSPGQFLKHYSPFVECYLASRNNKHTPFRNLKTGLENTVMIDFNGYFG